MSSAANIRPPIQRMACPPLLPFPGILSLDRAGGQLMDAPARNREAVMAYTLKQFCADHRALLTSGLPLAEALPQIADKLSILLRNPEFVAESFSDDTPAGKRTLHHDPDTDVYVLAHVYE